VIDSHISVSEYAKRRARVARSLKGAAAVVMAGEGSPPLQGLWTPDPHFSYLTGIRTEPGASVVFDPGQPDPSRRCVLVLKPRNPEAEAWDGRREPISQDLRARTGFDRVVRTAALGPMLTNAARRAKRLACLHTLATPSQPVSPDLALFRKLSERVPGTAIEDRSDLLPSLRAVKSQAELRLIRRAIEITHAGHAAIIEALATGTTERDLHNAFVGAIASLGSKGPAYNPIVGSGVNATVLHYNANDAPLGDSDLVCVDAGAEFGGYAADVTRTYPVSGRFSKRQREIYNLVLRALEASIAACKPGTHLHEIDRAGRAIIEKAGFGDTYIHGVGHHLGIEVHDATPDGPLQPGHVVTIEPGIYLPDEGIGVRIEDDIRITQRGSTNLSRAIPKDPDELETLIRAARRRASRSG